MQNFIHILLWWNINTIYNSYQFITQVVVGRVSNVTGLEANLNLMHIFGWIISSDDDIFHMCFGRSLLTESLLTDYWCTPSARTMEHSRSVLYRTCVFFTYTVWCQLTYFHERWIRPLVYYLPNDSTLKVFLTCQPVYHYTLWHDRTNVRNIPWWESIHLWNSVWQYRTILLKENM